MNTSANFRATVLLILLVLLQAVAWAQPVSAIATGRFHSLFIKSDGSLWAVGENPVGQLGDGLFVVVSPYGTNLPVRSVASDVTAVAAGTHHTLFIRGDHSLWGMGGNSHGQLGNASLAGSPLVIGTGVNPPEPIFSDGVTAVAAGDDHTLVLKDDTSLWGMGANRSGQLGDGTTNDSHVPKQIVASGVTAVAANHQQTFFLKNDGSLWAMGQNTSGQLGTGDYGTGHYANTPTQILASNVIAVAAGVVHTLILKRDGSLWGMGDNSERALGDGVPGVPSTPSLIVTNGVTAIAAGFSHSLFLKTDGSLWGMGLNASGQLGDGTFAQVNHPKQLVASGVVAVAAKNAHTLFLTEDGSLWALGNNTHGELGDGTFSDVNRAEQILGLYNRICVRQVDAGTTRLFFTGLGGANYALEHSDSLSPPVWVPQETNQASSFGGLLFTNTPPATHDHFWRVRYVP